MPELKIKRPYSIFQNRGAEEHQKTPQRIMSVIALNSQLPLVIPYGKLRLFRWKLHGTPWTDSDSNLITSNVKSECFTGHVVMMKNYNIFGGK